MDKLKKGFDVASVEAEEDLVIDIQFLLQSVLVESGITRAELAKRLGLSKARLSQLFAAESNPTVRTCARLFHALDKRLNVSVGGSGHKSSGAVGSDWHVEMNAEPVSAWKRRAAADQSVVAVLKEAMVSNDNYRNQVFVMDDGVPAELQAA
jgi:transcriptional regulator with XRE-family HTH domain